MPIQLICSHGLHQATFLAMKPESPSGFEAPALDEPQTLTMSSTIDTSKALCQAP